jgi:hypothetical protein
VLSSELSAAEQLKFRLLAEGLRMSDAAVSYIDARNGGRPRSTADYASTSGVILELDRTIWVNAPISDHNANFVDDDTQFTLHVDDDGLFVAGDGLAARARFWLLPEYHGTTNQAGEAYNSYAFTHADRVRIAPIEGCAMTCKFCDLPYEFRYRRKRVEGLIDAVERARHDRTQPAAHVLISGGTPRDADAGYVRDVYEATLQAFPDMAIDIMMVPVDGLLDVPRLQSLGLNELSINLEIYDEEIARVTMPHKYRQGRQHYLSFIENATEVLGQHRVRSMLMVGLEPVDQTLAGVQAILQHGGVPVLSPFRPDPLTPLRDLPPPDAATMVEVYLRAMELCNAHGSPLGPSCIPCSHNTMTLASSGVGNASRYYGDVHLV